MAADVGAERVLLVTGQDYPGPKWQETAPVLAEAIRGDSRIEVVVTENPKDLASPEINQYDAIVLAGDSPEAFNDVEHPTRVVPEKMKLTFKKGIANLPPHSLTILQFPGQTPR